LPRIVEVLGVVGVTLALHKRLEPLLELLSFFEDVIKVKEPTKFKLKLGYPLLSCLFDNLVDLLFWQWFESNFFFQLV